MERLIKNNKLTFLIAGVAMALILAGNGVISNLKNILFGTSSQESNQDAIAMSLAKDTEVKKALTNKIRGLAETLYSAFYGFLGWGTNEQKIYDVFDSLTTKSEIQALYVAYGKRYSSGSFHKSGFDSVDLVQQLKNSLTSQEFDKILPKLKLGGLA